MSSKLPTYAAVMATAAVMLALSGTAVAAAKIDGHDLMDRSVPGDKLIKNTVTGTEVKESSLLKVPDAGHLDGLGPSSFVQGKSNTVATDASKYVTVVSLPGLAKVTTKCSVDGQDESFRLVDTSSHGEFFTYQGMRELQPVDGPTGSILHKGTDFTLPVGPDSALDGGFSVTFDVIGYGENGAHFELHGITNVSNAGSCLVRGTVTHG